MKTLTLSLKKQWFELIKAGVKKEEYREIKDFYRARFFDGWDAVQAGGIYWYNQQFEKYPQYQYFDRLVFTLGYPKADDTERRLTFKNPRIRIGTGRPEWGAEAGKKYFVITWEEALVTEEQNIEARR